MAEQYQEYFGEESVMTVIRLHAKDRGEECRRSSRCYRPTLKDTVLRLEGPAQSAPRAIAKDSGTAAHPRATDGDSGPQNTRHPHPPHPMSSP